MYCVVVKKERQTERQKNNEDREKERHKRRKAVCQVDRNIERQYVRKTERLRDIKIERQKDNKVGLAVQFVSNCHSTLKREAYVRELRQFIPVDVYGKCE